MNIRPATAADIARFYGEAAVPVQFLALDSGQGPIALAGLAWLPEGLHAVSWLTDEAKTHPTWAMRLGHAAMAMVRAQSGPVYAVADPDEPTAPRTLRHFGFKQEGQRYVF